MLKYEIYNVTEENATLKQVIEVDPNDSVSISRLRKIHNNDRFYVNATDADSVFVLAKPQRRGNSKLNDQQVVKIFELKANENLSLGLITVRLHEEYDIAVSTETVRNVLNRKTFQNVEVPEEYLNKIEGNQMGSIRKKRQAISPEDKPKILELHNNGVSAKEISRKAEFPYSDTTIATFIRKSRGYQV